MWYLEGVAELLEGVGVGAGHLEVTDGIEERAALRQSTIQIAASDICGTGTQSHGAPRVRRSAGQVF